MITREQFSFPSADGIHQSAALRWLPEGECRGVVQIVHGMSEYIARYDGFAEFLAAHGFLVCGEDHLGHGRTAGEGPLGFFAQQDGWRTVVRDVRTLRELQGAACPGVPYFMLGHSLGSFLTRTYLIDYPGTLDGVILSGTGQYPAPLLPVAQKIVRLECKRLGRQGISPLIEFLSPRVSNLHFRPARTQRDWLSRDAEQVDRFLADPLCSFATTIGMFDDLLDGLRYLSRRENLARMDTATPVYFFSGGDDPVGQRGRGVTRAAERFRRAGCSDVTVKLYPGGRHEMFFETNRTEVFEDVLAWLDAKL